MRERERERDLRRDRKTGEDIDRHTDTVKEREWEEIEADRQT